MSWDFKVLPLLLLLAAAGGGAGELRGGDAPALMSPAAGTIRMLAPERTPAPWSDGDLQMPAVITPLTAGQPQRASRRDLWLAKDKADHLVVSALLTGLGYYATRQELNFSEARSRNLAPAFSLSLGLAKELRDRRRPGGFFSFKDLGADLLGCGLGYLFCSLGDY